MWTRRRFLTNAGFGLLAGAGSVFALPADNPGNGESRDMAIPDGSASKGMVTEEASRAINSGLEYLRINQLRDGSFGSTVGYQGHVAVTSLAGLAFMAGGHQPNRGKFGEVVTKTLRFVLNQENRTGIPGFLYNPGAAQHGPMYGHGFGTLFLSEVSGMVHDKAMREELQTKLKRAVNVILNSQNSEGGWRYKPRREDADISVTICQIMALRSARNAGLNVPKKVVDDCVKYIKKLQDVKEGWFKYMARAGGSGAAPAFARTAAGVAALFSAGVYKGPEIELGLDFLMKWVPGVKNFDREDREAAMHYFYGHYYAVQAMWTAGGDYWKTWYPAIRNELVQRQRNDGSWADGMCTHYGTAMACIILQVPNNYLPILQK